MRSALPCGSLLAAMAVFSVFPLMALDLPLHLKMGEIIVAGGRVPPTNVVLYTQAHTPCVNDKWLHQVAVYLAARAGGTGGLVLLRLALALGLTLATYRLARRFTGPEAAGAAVLLVMPLFIHRLALRPELWSTLFTAVFLRALLDPRAYRFPARRLATLGVLQALWANLHVYFPIGVGLALLAALPELLRRRFRPLGLGAVLAAACFLNPAGWRGAVHPFGVAASVGQLAGGAVSELGPVWSPAVPWALPRVGLGVALAAALLGLARIRFRVPLRVALTALPLVLLGLALHRNLPLAGLGLLLLLAAARPPGRRVWRVVVPVLSLAGAILVVAGPLADPARDGRVFGLGWAPRRFPFAAAAFLAGARPPGEVFNDLASGGTYVYEAYPEKRAFIDGNTSGYPAAFLEEYRRVLRLEIPHRALARKYRVTQFLLRHDARATRFLLPVLFRDEGLILAFYDPVGTVFLAREVAPDLDDRRSAWLEDVLPRVRDALFPARERAWRVLEQAARLVSTRPERVPDLARQACALDPWEARTFRVAALAYRAQNKGALEARAWRAAALLEGRVPPAPPGRKTR